MNKAKGVVIFIDLFVKNVIGNVRPEKNLLHDFGTVFVMIVSNR
jgi:hypothetical protein